MPSTLPFQPTPPSLGAFLLGLGLGACAHGSTSLHDTERDASFSNQAEADTPPRDSAEHDEQREIEATNFEELTLSANGLAFHARAAGPKSGELVLLLHGFPQTSFQWRYALRALGDAGYRAVAPDQRGYSEGARPEPVQGYVAAELVRDAVNIADALGAPRFHLVGHDWGALVAWITTAYFKDRVLSLTAVSTAHPRLIAQQRAIEGSCQAEATMFWSQRKAPDAAAKLLANDAQLLRAEFDGLPAPAIDEYVRVIGDESALNAALNWYRANIDPPDERPSVPNIEVPTLYVWGDEDPTNCQATADANADFVTAPYTFEAMKGIDHWLVERVPERFQQLLLEHISKYPDDRGTAGALTPSSGPQPRSARTRAR